MWVKSSSVFEKLRKNLYLNFILFYAFILGFYFLIYLIYYHTALSINVNLVYLIGFFTSLLGNYFVAFFYGEGLWHHFGLIITRMTIVHLLEGFFLPLFYFAPVVAIMMFIDGVSINSFSVYNFVSLFFIIFINAFNEEIIFRGYVFQLFAERRSPYATVLVFSVIFALAHLSNPNLLPIGFFNIFLAGVVFSIMYLRTKSLWLGIGFHTGWNFFQLILLGSPVSGVDYLQNIVRTKITDFPTILFGGQFGIEGGLFTTFVLILTIYIVARKYKPIPEIEAKKFREFYAPSKELDLSKFIENPRRVLPIPKTDEKKNLNTRE
ncbi:MAG: lysostaphin resistance A-like protein [Candidatus Kapaibacteriales bacterium]